MEFSPSILRLDACLCAAGTQLHPTELAAAGALLATQSAPAHLQALKQAAHQLRTFLRGHNHVIKQSLAFEALARYLGHPDWNTARKLTPAAGDNRRHPELSGGQGVYVFEMFDKSPGVADITAALGLIATWLPDIVRLRLLSQPVSEGHLEQWRAYDPAHQPLAGELNDSRRHWLESAIRQGRSSFGIAQPLRLLRHFVYVETKGVDATKQWTSRELGDVLEKLFHCRLRTPVADTFEVFGNLQSLPEGFLQWTPAAHASVSNRWLTDQSACCVSVFDFEWPAASPRLVRYGVGLAESLPELEVGQWICKATDKGVTLAQGADAGPVGREYASLLASSWMAEGKLASQAGGLPVVSRSGCVSFLDMWATCEQEERSPFFLVSAMSGSGKSFLANELVVDALSRHRNVRVVDFGRSYVKLAEVLSGEHVCLSEKTNVSLNLFTGISCEEHAQALLPLWASTLCEITSDHGLDMALLAEHLAAGWRQRREGLNVNYLAEVFLSAEDIGLVRMGAALQRLYFEQHGLLNGPSALRQMNNPMAVFDLEERVGASGPGKVVVSLLMANLAQEALLSPSPALYLLDEAWTVAKGMSASFSQCVLSCFARGSHAVGATVQSFDDVPAVPFVEELLQRSAWLLMLQQQSRGGLERFAQRVSPYSGLLEQPECVEELKSVKAGRGFSGVAVLTPEKNYGVYHFAVDEYTYLTYSTNPRDHHEYKALRERMSPAEAIAQQLALRRRAAVDA